MAKKVKENKAVSAAPPKKKGHGCLTCLVTAVVLVFVFIGGAFGAGYWAWGKYVQPEVGISLIDAFSLIGSLYKDGEDEIVTNTYSEKDLQSFYVEFKDKLFLDEGTQISVSDILNAVTNKDDGTAQVDKAALGIAETDGEAPETPSNGSLTGNTALDEFLESLNFDFSTLENYDGEPNILEITDKELAALLNEVVSEAAQIQSVASIETQYGIKISEAVSVKQVKIANSSQSVGDNSGVSILITLGINIRDMVKSMVPNLVPQLAGQDKLVAFISKLLPKQLLVTAEAYPNDAAHPAAIRLNAFSQEKMDKVLTIINNVAFKDGKNIEGMLTEINGKLIEAIQKLNAVIPVNFVESGNIEARPIQGMMTMLKLTVSEGQFLAMLRDVNLPTGESLGLVLDEELQRAETEKAVDNITESYAIDNGDGFINADNLIDSLQLLLKDDENIKRIKLAQLEYGELYDSANGKAEVSYQGLSGILNAYIGKELAATSGGLDIKVVDSGFDSATGAITVNIRADVSSQIKLDNQNSLVKKLVGQLVPKYIYLTVSFKQDGSETVIVVNKTDEALTRAHLDTLTSIGASLGMDLSSFGYDNLKTTVTDKLVKGFNDIEDKLGAEIEMLDECVMLPNIFQLVAGNDQLKDPATGESDLSDGEVYNIFKAAYTYGESSDLGDALASSAVAENANGFVGELNSKYYIKEKDADGNAVLDGSDAKLLTEKLKGMKDTFSQDLNMKALVADNRPVGELKPIINESELGFLINGNGIIDATTISFLKDIHVITSAVSDDKINLILSGKISMTSSSEDKTGEKYAALFPETVYINAEILLNVLVDKEDGTSGNGVKVKITVNNMSDEDLNNFILMIKKFTKKDINLDTIQKQLASKVEGFIHDMGSGGAVQLAFNVGNVTVDGSIFDLATDMIYSAPEAVGKPTAEQFRSMLINLNTATGIAGNVAADVYEMSKQINDKYYLSDSYKLAEALAEEEEGITAFDRLTNVAANYTMSVNGMKMAADTRDIALLRPTISAGEMAALLAQKITIQASGIKNVSLKSFSVLSADCLRLAYSGAIDATAGGGENSKYASLMPESIDIIVEVDLTKATGSESCVNFTINTMSNTAVDGEKSDMDVFFGLLNTATGKDMSADAIADDADVKIKESMSKLKDLDVTFEPQDGGDGSATLCSVFDAAGKQIYTDGASHGAAVRSTVKAMFAPLEKHGASAAEKFEFTPTINFPAIGGMLTDASLGALIVKEKATLVAAANGADIEVLQTAVVSTSAADLDIKQSLSSYDGWTNDVLAITLAVDVASMTGKTFTLLPQSLYVSVLLADIDGTYSPTLLYNNLSAADMGVLDAIIAKSNVKMFDAANFADRLLNIKLYENSAFGVSLTLSDVAKHGTFNTTAVGSAYTSGNVSFSYSLTA